MKLFYSPGACSFAPHILLCETGLPYDLERVDLGRHQTARGEDFFAINPKGSVPVLQLDSGEYLTEGPVIAQYICDTAERRDLMPAAGTLARYQVMEWLNYLSSEIHKSFSPLFNPALDAAAKGAFIQALVKKFGWVSAQLARQPYLAGKDFSAADAYLFTVAGWAPYTGVDISALQPLQDYLARIAERPAVKAARKAEA